jgi:hypothetical protein
MTNLVVLAAVPTHFAHLADVVPNWEAHRPQRRVIGYRRFAAVTVKDPSKPARTIMVKPGVDKCRFAAHNPTSPVSISQEDIAAAQKEANYQEAKQARFLEIVRYEGMDLLPGAVLSAGSLRVDREDGRGYDYYAPDGDGDPTLVLSTDFDGNCLD